MRLTSTLRSWLGTLLVLVGVLLGLALSAGVTWGEAEAGLYASYQADMNLRVQCPLMLAADESGVVSAKIINLTNENSTPTVSAEISHAGAPRKIDQIVDLKPGGSKMLEWTVTPSDVIYEQLILVNILQLRYRDNPSMLGSCGIVLFSLFGLNGTETFMLVFALSLISMISGGLIWAQARRRPFDPFSSSLARIGASLMVITGFALLSTLRRWWGLTIFLDALILLVMGVIFADFVLFQRYKG